MQLEDEIKRRGYVLWFTGLPCSGKTTLAIAVARQLQEMGLAVELLDGDEVRSIFPSTGFDRESRNTHVRQMGFLAARLEKHGVIVVASFVSPYRESRQFVRNLCADFIEIFVSTPLVECEKRDVKGMYEKARRGEISQFTGIDDPYEPPLAAEIKLDTSAISVETCVQQILQFLTEKSLIATNTQNTEH